MYRIVKIRDKLVYFVLRYFNKAEFYTFVASFQTYQELATNDYNFLPAARKPPDVVTPPPPILIRELNCSQSLYW